MNAIDWMGITLAGIGTIGNVSFFFCPPLFFDYWSSTSSCMYVYRCDKIFKSLFFPSVVNVIRMYVTHVVLMCHQLYIFFGLLLCRCVMFLFIKAKSLTYWSTWPSMEIESPQPNKIRLLVFCLLVHRIVNFSICRSWCWRWGAKGICHIRISLTMVGNYRRHLVCRYLILCII